MLQLRARRAQGEKAFQFYLDALAKFYTSVSQNPDGYHNLLIAAECIYAMAMLLDQYVTPGFVSIPGLVIRWIGIRTAGIG